MSVRERCPRWCRVRHPCHLRYFPLSFVHMCIFPLFFPFVISSGGFGRKEKGGDGRVAPDGDRSLDVPVKPTALPPFGPHVVG